MPQALITFLLAAPAVFSFILGVAGIWIIRAERRKEERALPRWAGPTLIGLGAALLLIYLPLFAILFGAIPS